MIISRTPFRISFFGGGTDFPHFYHEHGGATILTTIDKYCYLSVHELSPFFRHRFRASYARTELVNDPAEFRHPLVRETLLMLGVTNRMEITHIADLPGQTGLGTSSSFTVGLLNALHAFRGESPSPETLAREAITVERERVGDPGGHQDQYAAAYGGFLRLDFRPDATVRVTPLVLDNTLRDALAERLMLFYTSGEGSAADILHRQTKAVGRNTDSLLRMRALVDEAQNFLEKGELGSFGDLLDTAWQMKKSLAHGISNSLIDQAYEAARTAGARGGKILGAGGRGFLLVFSDPSDKEKVRRALRAFPEVRFAPSDSGSAIIFRTTE